MIHLLPRMNGRVYVGGGTINEPKFKVHQPKNRKWWAKVSLAHWINWDLFFLFPDSCWTTGEGSWVSGGTAVASSVQRNQACVGCTGHGHQLDGLVLSHAGKTLHRIHKLSVGKTGKTYNNDRIRIEQQKLQGASSLKSTKGSEMLPPNLQSVTSRMTNTYVKKWRDWPIDLS